MAGFRTSGVVEHAKPTMFHHRRPMLRIPSPHAVGSPPFGAPCVYLFGLRCSLL